VSNRIEFSGAIVSSAIHAAKDNDSVMAI